jgi:hypothetical protein
MFVTSGNMVDSWPSPHQKGGSLAQCKDRVQGTKAPKVQLYSVNKLDKKEEFYL